MRVLGFRSIDETRMTGEAEAEQGHPIADTTHICGTKQRVEGL